MAIFLYYHVPQTYNAPHCYNQRKEANENFIKSLMSSHLQINGSTYLRVFAPRHTKRSSKPKLFPNKPGNLTVFGILIMI